jgi:hypothetical protein
MATTTNFSWTTPDNTGYVKDGALAIRTLGSAIDSSMALLKGGTTGQVLTKASGFGMDFVWSTVSSTPRIGQVVTATTTSSTSSTGGAGWVDVSGLSVSITPTLSSSKVLVMTSFTISSSTGGTNFASGYVQLLRGATSLSSRLSGLYYPSGGGVNTALYNQCTFTYLDSPATTSATTYKMQINNISSAANFIGNGDGASVQITAMEVLV